MRKAFPVVVISLMCCLLFAGKFWQDEPYVEWSQKDALNMLSDSPWAQAQTFSTPQSGHVSAIDPAGTGGIPPSPSAEARRGDFTVSRQYYVRFQSAAPIRMALARLSLLNGNVDRQKAEEFVNTPPGNGEIVIMLSAAPGQDRTELDRTTTDLLKNETYLILKKSKERIPLLRYLSPAEAGGTEAVLLFERMRDGRELVTLEEEEIRLICELGPETRLNRKFKLKDMVFKDKLEI